MTRRFPTSRSPGPRAWFVALLLAGAALPSGAREVAEVEEFSAFDSQLRLSPEIRRAKIRASRERWSWALIGSALSGYDSNSVQSPDARASGLSSLSLRGELRRDLTAADALELTAGARYQPHWRRSDELDEHSQQLTGRYTRRLGDGRRAGFLAAFEHENDHAVDIDGEPKERDFEYLSYRLQPSFVWGFGAVHSLRLRYGAQYRDYAETPGLDSIDWWGHGPALRYQAELGESAGIGAEYRFAIQSHVEDLAARSNGDKLAGAPTEEHFFHTVVFDAAWQARSWLRLSGGYRFRLKDDRYRGFESFDSHRAELGATLALTTRLDLDLRGSYELRDFEKRPADAASSTLHFDRYRSRLSIRHSLGEHLALLAGYDFGARDSNRSSGNSFRSYRRHRVLAGVSVVY